ncbi:hypothetical protein JHN63_24725 [Streptomyces sp. MBT65]|nr:hypothetical protein [Streptomyces sp. MBT65]
MVETSTSRLFASAIWVSRRARLRSTSACAEAGMAGSCDFTSGQVIVPTALAASPVSSVPPAASVAAAVALGAAVAVSVAPVEPVAPAALRVQAARESSPVGLVPLRPMEMAMRSMVETRFDGGDVDESLVRFGDLGVEEGEVAVDLGLCGRRDGRELRLHVRAGDRPGIGQRPGALRGAALVRRPGKGGTGDDGTGESHGGGTADEHDATLVVLGESPGHANASLGSGVI